MDMNGDVDEAFGAEMAATRRRRGLSQRDLAERLELRNLRLDVPAISRIEKGRRAVRLSEAMTIVSVLDMSLDELVPRSSVERAVSLHSQALDSIREGFGHATSGVGAALGAWDALRAEGVALPPTDDGEASPATRREYLEWIVRLCKLEWHGPRLGYKGMPDQELAKDVVAFFEGMARVVTSGPQGVADEPQEAP